MKRNFVNVVLWALNAVLWTALSVWRIAEGQNIVPILFTVLIAALSVVCLVLQCRAFAKSKRKEARPAETNVDGGEG